MVVVEVMVDGCLVLVIEAAVLVGTEEGECLSQRTTTGCGDDGSSDDARHQKQATLAKGPGSVAAALGKREGDKRGEG